MQVNFDAGKAVDAMVHDANTQSPKNCRAIGRDGAEFYKKLGWQVFGEIAPKPPGATRVYLTKDL